MKTFHLLGLIFLASCNDFNDNQALLTSGPLKNEIAVRDGSAGKSGSDSQLLKVEQAALGLYPLKERIKQIGERIKAEIIANESRARLTKKLKEMEKLLEGVENMNDL